MTVDELIDLLAQLDPEAEVRIATQPAWPLQFHVEGVATSRDVHDATALDDEQEDTTEPVVWLVAGDQHRDNPYAPTAVFQVATDQL